MDVSRHISGTGKIRGAVFRNGDTNDKFVKVIIDGKIEEKKREEDQE